MKLKAQMNEQIKIANRIRKEAQKSGDTDMANVALGVRIALEWVQGSRSQDDYLYTELLNENGLTYNWELK